MDDQPTEPTGGDPTGPLDPREITAAGDDPAMTRPSPQAHRPVDADATRAMPPVDPDATRAIPAVPPSRPDATAVAPPLPSEWKGQAAVRAGTPTDQANQEWVPVEQGRAWWLPILLAVIGLVFIIGIAFALVFVLKDKNSPAPSVTPTATHTLPPSVTPSTTPSPSSTASSAAVTAVIPANAVGESVDDLKQQLDALGIQHHETAQTDDSQPAGTVLSVTPAAGTAIPLTQVVEIIYAQPSGPSSAPPSQSAPASPSSSSSR
jgi:S-DNA-T family DNA segregation ATPase FtsK/SpoIIIE